MRSIWTLVFVAVLLASPLAVSACSGSNAAASDNAVQAAPADSSSQPAEQAQAAQAPQTNNATESGAPPSTGNSPAVQTVAEPNDPPQDYTSGGVWYSSDQLDNLVAPVALYPDPLLAQVLPAATYPDQIEQAARWRRDHDNFAQIDDMPWSLSVKAVAHYPTVLDQMAVDPDWTTALGQAYAAQPDDLMAAVQRLRHLAWQQGNLVTNGYQQVIVSGSYITIDPVQPAYIYAPQYNPHAVFFTHGSGLITFGAGLVIGAWLGHDFDWGHHRIYYTGWQGGGWVARSRPHVQMDPAYIGPQHSTVEVNRDVVRNRVDYARLNRQTDVHPSANFNNVAHAAPANPRAAPAAPAAAGQPGVRAPERRTPDGTAGSRATPPPEHATAHAPENRVTPPPPAHNPPATASEHRAVPEHNAHPAAPAHNATPPPAHNPPATASEHRTAPEPNTRPATPAHNAAPPPAHNPPAAVSEHRAAPEHNPPPPATAAHKTAPPPAPAHNPPSAAPPQQQHKPAPPAKNNPKDEQKKPPGGGDGNY